MCWFKKIKVAYCIDVNSCKLGFINLYYMWKSIECATGTNNRWLYIYSYIVNRMTSFNPFSLSSLGSLKKILYTLPHNSWMEIWQHIQTRARIRMGFFRTSWITFKINYILTRSAGLVVLNWGRILLSTFYTFDRREREPRLSKLRLWDLN